MPGPTDWSVLLHHDYGSIDEMLTDLYITKQMSLHDISLFLGINPTPLTRKLKQLGIPVKRKGRPKSNGNGRVKQVFREARPDGFSENSRENEKRDCRNFADCLTVCAILDNHIVPCNGCDGQPAMNHFLHREYIINFENHHVEGVRHGAWHPTDKITKRGFDMNKPADVRKLIQQHNLSDRPMQANDFRYFRFQRG